MFLHLAALDWLAAETCGMHMSCTNATRLVCDGFHRRLTILLVVTGLLKTLHVGSLRKPNSQTQLRGS